MQRLDLDLVVAAADDMLHAQHAHRALAPDDQDAREAVIEFLARLRRGEGGMAGRLGEVQRLDLVGDRADQALARRQLGDVDGVRIEAACREQLELPLAQQIKSSRPRYRAPRR